MYYLRTKSAVDPLKGLGIDMSTTKPNSETQEVPSTNNLIQDNSEEMKLMEMVMGSRPTDSPFECEGCGS
jgi:hypothetical protein